MKTSKLVKQDLFLTKPCWELLMSAVLELELELDASVDPSHPTDDIEEESESLYISLFVSNMAM